MSFNISTYELHSKIAEAEAILTIGYPLAFTELEKTIAYLDIMVMADGIDCDAGLLAAISNATLTDEMRLIMNMQDGGTLGVKEFFAKIWDTIVAFFTKIGEWLGLVEKKVETEAEAAAKDSIAAIQAFLSEEAKTASSDAVKKEIAKLKEQMEKDIEASKDVKGTFAVATKAVKDLVSKRASLPGLSKFFKKLEENEVSTIFSKELKDVKSFTDAVGEMAQFANYFPIRTGTTLSHFEAIKANKDNLEEAVKAVDSKGALTQGKPVELGGITYNFIEDSKDKNISTFNILGKGKVEVVTIDPWKMEDKEKAMDNMLELVGKFVKAKDESLKVVAKLKEGDFSTSVAAVKKLLKKEPSKDTSGLLGSTLNKSTNIVMSDTKGITLLMAACMKCYKEAMKTPLDVA